MATSALDATAGGASSNAYCTEAQADQYHDDRPAVGTTWSTATSDAKAEAILHSTRLLDALFEWNGSKNTEGQALRWPRAGITDRDGYTVSSTAIPAALRDACAEYARQLLVEDRAGDSDIETKAIRELRAGPVALKFDASTAKVVPDLVVNLIPRHWYSSVSGRQSLTTELLRA